MSMCECAAKVDSTWGARRKPHNFQFDWFVIRCCMQLDTHEKESARIHSIILVFCEWDAGKGCMQQDTIWFRRRVERKGQCPVQSARVWECCFPLRHGKCGVGACERWLLWVFVCRLWVLGVFALRVCCCKRIVVSYFWWVLVFVCMFVLSTVHGQRGSALVFCIPCVMFRRA